MRRGRVKVVKSVCGDKAVGNIFNQMLGADVPKLDIIYPKLVRVREAVAQLVQLFTSLVESPFMRLTVEFAKQKGEIESFLARVISMMQVYDAKINEDLNSVDDETHKMVAAQYAGLKKSDIVNAFIVMCDKLVPYKKQLVAGDEKFITSMPGAEWFPLPFCCLNVKYVFAVATEGTRKYFVTLLCKAYQISYSIWSDITSPDIEIGVFIEMLMNNVESIQKIPELSRCGKAFAKIRASVRILETNHGEYYRDFIRTKDNTIMIQHFILDVSKSSEVDAETTMQFNKIINFYKKQQATNKDPRAQKLFQVINDSFKEMSRGTENLTQIRSEDSESDEEEEEEADEEPEIVDHDLMRARIASQHKSVDQLVAEINAVEGPQRRKRK